MVNSSSGDTPLPLTDLLQLWQRQGTQIDPDQFDGIYLELKRLARAALARESANHTLQATDLVNELYLILDKQNPSVWENRLHFFSVVSLMMRRILVDHARRKKRIKRGDPQLRVTLSEDKIQGNNPTSLDVLAVHHALERLAALDARHALIAELKLFGGFTDQEIAESLSLSSRTIKRDWRIAKGWLKTCLATSLESESEDSEDPS